MLIITEIIEKICIEGLGCIGDYMNTKIWIPEKKQSKLETSERLNVQFVIMPILLTGQFKTIPHDAEDRQIKSLDIKSERRTLFLIHGYKHDYNNSDWYQVFWKTVLRHGHRTYQVIGVDWGKEANEIYPFAALNTRKVGKIIAKFIARLMDLKNLESGMITLIGFSLGAHVAGFTGKNCKKDGFVLGKIVGNYFYSIIIMLLPRIGSY